MLGISKAFDIFRRFPEDPYVIIPKTNIEIRFGEDGMIVAAYNADMKGPEKRWHSQEFDNYLKAGRSGNGA